MISTEEFFRARADIRAADECWPWVGSVTGDGYGQMRGRGAHRVAYELHVGPIPTGLVIDHLCHVRHCVNPRHLEAVTNQENSRRQPTAKAKYKQTESPRASLGPKMLALIDECARRNAEAAPPLTDEQRHVIATMFRTGPRKRAA